MTKTVILPDHPGITAEELFESMYRAQETSSCFGDWMDSEYRVRNIRYPDVVWGAGDTERAKFLAVGEGPGHVEGMTGIPFSGPAGVVLSSIIHAVGMSRMNNFFITNAVVATPAARGRGIGKPSTEDILRDRRRISSVVEDVNPRAVVLLGKYALGQASYHSGLATAVGQGKEFNWDKLLISRYIGWYKTHEEKSVAHLDLYPCPVLVVYHPAYLLYMEGRGSNSFDSVRRQYYGLFHSLRSYA